MSEMVTIRDLRNRSADVLARVSRGETLTVTRDGDPVATVSPLPRRRLSSAELVKRWRQLPRVDVAQLRADMDEFLDPSL